MSEDKDPALCAAYGCPCIGTMSSGTSGNAQWWCWLHYGRDASRFQAITAEINRLSWLALAIRDIRMFGGMFEWPAYYKRITEEITLAQRSDLLWKKAEALGEGQIRLEREFNIMLDPVLKGCMRTRSSLALADDKQPETFQPVKLG